MSSFQSTLSAYFINSLWQLPVIFLVTWAVAASARRCGPALRHRMWVTAFFLQIFLPAAFLLPADALRTFWPLALWGWLHHAPSSQAHITVLVGDTHIHSPLGPASILLTVLVAAYLVSLFFFAAQLLWNLYTVRRLRREATPAVLPCDLQTSWERCKQRFGLLDSDLELATSAGVQTPVTIGVSRKLVLLPGSFPYAFSADDFSSAAAHELAHVRRADFAKNLAYRILLLPVAYHPFSRWTLAHIAETREMLCDTLAADAVSSPGNYAHFLLRLASTLASQPPAITPHAIGLFDANTLERRIMYLKRPLTHAKLKQRLAFAAIFTLTLSLTCASALALRWNAPSMSSAPAPAAPHRQSGSSPAGPVRISSEVVSGQILSRVNPEYPPMARAAGVSGSVVLHAIIGKNGTMQSLQVVSGSPMLQDSAMEAVRQWVYRPYLLNGSPVEVDTTITVNFMLSE